MTQFKTIAEYVDSLSRRDQKVIQEYRKLTVRFCRHQDVNKVNSAGRP
jgi:hypothetical protein